MEDVPAESLTALPPTAPANGAGFMYGEPSMLYIAWADPESGGSAPVTNYLLTLTPTDLQSEEHYIDVPVITFSKLIDCISIQATVKASNNNGDTYGPEYTFPLITYVNPPYSPPSSAQAVPLEPGFASVSWTAPEVAPEGNAYYVITTNSSSVSDPVLMFRTDNITQLSYIVPELNAESRYYFTVQVQNQVGTSPIANTNTIIFPPQPPPVKEPAAETIVEPAAETILESIEPIDTTQFDALPMAPPITEEEPLPEGYTEAPAEEAVTEAPAEEAVTEAPAEEAVTEAPAEEAVTETPQPTE